MPDVLRSSRSSQASRLINSPREGARARLSSSGTAGRAEKCHALGAQHVACMENSTQQRVRPPAAGHAGSRLTVSRRSSLRCPPSPCRIPSLPDGGSSAVPSLDDWAPPQLFGWPAGTVVVAVRGILMVANGTSAPPLLSVQPCPCVSRHANNSSLERDLTPPPPPLSRPRRQRRSPRRRQRPPSRGLRPQAGPAGPLARRSLPFHEVRSAVPSSLNLFHLSTEVCGYQHRLSAPVICRAR